LFEPAGAYVDAEALARSAVGSSGCVSTTRRRRAVARMDCGCHSPPARLGDVRGRWRESGAHGWPCRSSPS